MERNGLVQIVFEKTPPGTNYRPGHWSWVPVSRAAEYIDEGYGREWNPGEEKNPTIVNPTPTMSNTKKEIEGYLDSESIEYDEYATKAELLELINE